MSRSLAIAIGLLLIVIGGAIVLATYTSFVARHWQFLVTSAAAIIGFLWTTHTYFQTRSDELAWRRTEFLFAQAQYLETDEGMSQVLMLLEDRHPTWTLDSLLGTRNPIAPDGLTLRQELDKTLNVFDRFAYAVFVARTMRTSELMPLEWYLEKINSHSSLKSYCETHGYRRVLQLAESVAATPD